MADQWTWLGHYRDGETISEFDETGASRGFAAVDQARLVGLEFVPLVEGLHGAFVRIPDDARPILFRRRSIELDYDSGEQRTGPTISVLGFQRTVNGRNVKALVALYEDGSVLLTDDSEAL